MCVLIHTDTRVEAHHLLSLEIYFGHSSIQILSHLLYHSPSLYVSLFSLLQHPQPPLGDNRLLGCQAAEPLRDGRDDNDCPLRDWRKDMETEWEGQRV